MPRTVSVKLQAEVAEYRRKMQGAAADTRTLVSGLDEANRAGRLDAVTDAATGVGLGLLGAAGAAVAMAADFDKQMSSVQAATHASGVEIDQLRQAALDAGADTKYSATEAAKGIEELSKAGVATADILGGGLDGALDLAAAGELDVAEAAETAASAMTQFKLSGSEVPHIADLLAAAAGKAQGSVHDMGAALNQSGLVSAQMGLSIEETTGTLASFASAGLMGSDAGTSLKTALLMLANPTEKSSNLMAELGINAYDASGKFVGMQDLAGQLQSRLGTLTQEQRNSALATIFGSDAIRAASVLYEQGEKGIEDWTKKVNDSGYAAETAKIKTDNLAGDVERLTGSLQTLAIESGGGANSGLRVLAQGANAVVDQFALLPSGISGTVTMLGLLGGALVLGASAWVKVRRSNADALEELRATGPAGEKAAGGLEKTTKWAGRAALALGATQVAAAGIAAAAGSSVNPQIDALANSLADWERNGKKAGEATRVLGDDFEHLGYDLGTLDSGFWADLGNGFGGMMESISGLGGVMDESLQHARERLAGIDGALTQMVQNGNAQQADRLFTKLAAEAAKSGVSVDDLRKGLPQYAGALQLAGTQSQKSATDITAVGESASDAEKMVDALKDAFDELFGAQMSMDRANLEYQEGIGALTKELKTGAKTLNASTEEGRKNRSAVLDQIDSINDLRDSRIKHGVALDDANKKYTTDIEGLKKQMRQAGFTKGQIAGLTDAYAALPSKVQTNVSAQGIPGVRKQLADLVVLQMALKKGTSMGNARALAGDAAAARDRGLFHTGGYTGPGGKYDEAGIVHREEYVVRKEARSKFEAQHPGDLDYLNKYGELPGYAGGGRVRYPYPTTAAMTRIPSRREVESVVVPEFGGGGGWPSSPSAVRHDSGRWRQIKSFLEHANMGGSFGNGYRPGDPKWHGSGWAVDWMGFEQDALATRLAAMKPLELIHRTNQRDYAYTRGKNKGSFRQALMQAHRNHIHIAMEHGGIIDEPIWGVGASGKSYAFGEGYKRETVVPGVPNWLPPQAGPAPITVIVQGAAGSDFTEATAVLRGILAATQGVGGQVAGALAGSSARALQMARTGAAPR